MKFKSSRITEYLGFRKVYAIQAPNVILNMNYLPHSPDISSCGFHIAMNIERYVLKTTKSRKNVISKYETLNSFNMFLDRAKRCIESEGAILKPVNEFHQNNS